ncbi:hypothetical protein JCM10212_006638 [Sporobolomyces blumeae]
MTTIPQTPPRARHSSNGSVLAAMTPLSPARSKPGQNRFESPFFVRPDDLSDEEREDVEDESPIKDRRGPASSSRTGGRHSIGSLSFSLASQSSGDPTGRRASTPAVAPELAQTPSTRRDSIRPGAQRYVPPHLRNQSAKENISTSTPYLPSLGKNSLSSFDRTGAPRAEDSFYTFSNEASLAFSRYPSVESTPNTSRSLSQGVVACTASPARGVVASPPPRSLPRTARLDVSCFDHPQMIPEEDDSPCPSGGDNEHVDALVELDEPAGPVLALDSITASASVPASVLNALLQNLSVEECSGCGAQPHASFVLFTPCRHACCPDCLNAMVNGAAHKPPRPADCFACSHRVESFVPTADDLYESRGGPGLAQVLAAILKSERGKRRVEGRQHSVSAGTRPHQDDPYGDSSRRLSRSSRRRSSVVAAAIAATLLSSSSARKSVVGFDIPDDVSSPGRKLLFDRDNSLSVAATPSRQGSLASLPSDVVDEDSLSSCKVSIDRQHLDAEASPTSSKWSTASQGPRTPGLDWASEPMPDISTSHCLPAETSGRDDEHGDRSASRPTEWPVIRLDNVPWEITCDEIEQWLPEGSLASDLEPAVGLSEGHDPGKKVGITLAVHILCNRADGRTLNQAFVECSSIEAAKEIVRTRGGSRIRGRPLHLAMSSQAELMATVFPTYTPGFAGVDAVPVRKGAPPCPLLLQSEMTGLLNLCRLENPHALKAPERPYYNLVSILEKLPWHQPETHNAQQIVRLFNSSAAAIEILETVQSRVLEWRDILTVLVDAVLRCPAFRPSQKSKIVRLAARLGFDQSADAQTIDVFYPKPRSTRASAGGLSHQSFVPISLRDKTVSATPDPSYLVARKGELEAAAHLVENGVSIPLVKRTQGTSSEKILDLAKEQAYARRLPTDYSPTPPSTYVFPGSSTTSPSPAGSAQNGYRATAPTSNNVQNRNRRRSSIARRLGIDVSLVVAVAKELGISISPV